MELNPLFFYLFAGTALCCSLFVILKKSAITSALNLIMVFFCFAGIYAMMKAHLIAALQVLVYAGAIMVLFVFVIMLLNADGPTLDLQKSSKTMRMVLAGLCAATLAIFIGVFRSSPLPEAVNRFSTEEIEALGGNVQVLSEAMFSDFILPFELTSVLLLAAIIGTVAIGMRKRHQNRGTHARTR